MALRYYDEALLNKIKNWVKDPNMRITGPDETRRLFEYMADVTNDEPIKLPLIALRRGRGITLQSVNKRPLTFDGITIEANKEKSIQLNGIPVTISYQIDIYTRYFAECDEYVRNFLFNFINFPKLTINIPYEGTNLVYDANITLNTSIEDNSDIPERLVAGQFTRFTFTFEINDAYMFSVPIRDNVSVDCSNIEIETKLYDN